MRNTQATRYARWAATAAFLLVVIVSGVYLRRAWRQSAARRNAPPAVPAGVQQQSAEFSFSKVEQEHTLFTVRASRAIEFKDQRKSLLEDVRITIYGRDGTRDDTIHARRCDYEPDTGHIICRGEVEFDLESAQQGPRSPGERSIRLTTRDVSFSRETGELSTSEPVDFRFPNGEGRGVGMVYSAHDARVGLEHAVELKLWQPNWPGSAPTVLTGGSLEYGRRENILRLSAPVHVLQGSRELTAGSLTLDLDSDLRLRRAVAGGKPELHSAESNGQLAVAAVEFAALLNPGGWVEHLLAEGDVRGNWKGSGSDDYLLAQRVEFAMEPKLNRPRQMTATGDVRVEAHAQGESRTIETAALRLQFISGAAAKGRGIKSGETLAPATIESRSSREAALIRAGRFTARFGPRDRLERLWGHSGVVLERRIGTSLPQSTTAQELEVTFGADGGWASVVETGDVRFREGERTATARRARIDRAADTVELDGSPVVADGVTRTAATWMEIHQGTGELRAGGGVRTTDLAAGPVRVSADALESDSASGHALYSPHARLWQGDSIVESDAIELWRAEHRLEARGNVHALLPQTPGPERKPWPPMLWNIHAPRLTSWTDQNKVLLEGGVSAESDQGELHSRTLALFLSGGATAANGRRQLVRALAQGGVVVQQGDRRGTSEQAEYTAAEGKFVLFGGHPTLTDASGDTTTGHSLTFFIASDTILVDSQAGFRTLTEHRIKK